MADAVFALPLCFDFQNIKIDRALLERNEKVGVGSDISFKMQFSTPHLSLCVYG